MKKKLYSLVGKTDIWLLAIGYFLCYIPYSIMVKAVSCGFFPGMERGLSGIKMIPAVLIGTVIGFLIYLTLSGQWSNAGKIRFAGLKMPFSINSYTLISGLATAVIIVTTTLAFCMPGVSILFALLLMRGGVLIMGPVVDLVFQRKVHGYSWIAFGLSIGALTLAIADQSRPEMTFLVFINFLAYVLSYAVRIHMMTGNAKTNNSEITGKYFVEEMIAAGAALLIAPLLLVLFFPLQMAGLNRGYSELLSLQSGLPCMAIGLFYSALYFFGTNIYLNHRENTFCIPVNRCASLLSGVVATLLLSLFGGQPPVPSIQWMISGIILIALLVLSFPLLTQLLISRKVMRVPKIYYFVCGGNTSRSPIAKAFCEQELSLITGLSPSELAARGIVIRSAGISAIEGQGLEQNAFSLLSELNLHPNLHLAHNLQADEALKAEKIWCMTLEQTEALKKSFPLAAQKIFLLDPVKEIENPHGKPHTVIQKVAIQIRQAVKARLSEIIPADLSSSPSF